MKNEKQIIHLIEKLQSGLISPEEKAQLKTLLEKHPQYQDLVRTHQLLSKSKHPFPVPETDAFSQMRATVMRQIRMEESDNPGWLQNLIEKIKITVARPEMAIAALTLIIGFLFGRALPPDKDSFTSNLVGQISGFAKDNIRLADLQKTPYTYSNISFREVDQGKVALSFDVTTHLNVTARKDDPLVRDIIAQSLLSGENIGTDLKAIAYTEQSMDRKIKEALIFSMEKAPVLAVRMKAMERLSTYDNDREIERAFLDILREEESVKMRLSAIDYLTRNQVDTEILHKTIDESQVLYNPAVLIKVEEYSEKIKSSTQGD